MSLNNLVSKIPAWLGFAVLSAVGALMFIHGAVDPLDVELERGEKAGFIIFGLCMLVIGAVSLILRAKSNLAGRTGVVGAVLLQPTAYSLARGTAVRACAHSSMPIDRRCSATIGRDPVSYKTPGYA